ncbi:hypothetical protein ScPMuIL_012257 [Solemya velum]
MGAFPTTPVQSLYVAANEPSLRARRSSLSLTSRESSYQRNSRSKPRTSPRNKKTPGEEFQSGQCPECSNARPTDTTTIAKTMFEMEDKLADNFQDGEPEEAKDMPLREEVLSILPEKRPLEWQKGTTFVFGNNTHNHSGNPGSLLQTKVRVEVLRQCVKDTQNSANCLAEDVIMSIRNHQFPKLANEARAVNRCRQGRKPVSSTFSCS